MITRHFVDVAGRRMHYRCAGSGPSLLLVHRSPRSSREYEGLMRRWSAHFTCIAPDTPGFGQSEPLAKPDPDITDYAQAVHDFCDALGLGRVAGFGYHSGGVIPLNAARLQPHRLTALAMGGYAQWTPEELALFGTGYLPPFRPQPMGEHLAWLWNRTVEQSWFFPWFDTRPQARLASAHDDLAQIDVAIQEMLDAGDAYRIGYGAVFAAPRDLPPPGAETPPVLIAVHRGELLQAHIERLGPLPDGWRALTLPTQADEEAACLAHLLTHPAPEVTALPEAADEGFVRVEAGGFSGLVHWRGTRTAAGVVLPAPGGSVETLALDGETLGFDLPGHGLSDDWPPGVEPTLEDWVEAVAAALPDTAREVVGEGLSSLLALALAARLKLRAGGLDALTPLDPTGWADRLLPEVTPDRFGAYLHRAWSVARAEQLFWPWFEASGAHAIPLDPAALEPDRLARRHRELVRGRAGRRLARVLLQADREALTAAAPALGAWLTPDWAAARDDIWRPARTG